MDVDAVTKVLSGLEQDLRAQLEAVRETKTMINKLCKMSGMSERYPDAHDRGAEGGEAIRSDQYYGKPLATAVREYLEYRKARHLGPATASEIHRALVGGGYQFDTKDDLNAKRGLRVSLSKNAVTFHRLPNGSWGLLEWYPEARARRGSKKDANEKVDDPASEGADSEKDD
jgi:hypothetical protein